MNGLIVIGETLIAAAQSTTAHGKMIFLHPMMDGNLVYLICDYSTGDAAGQNMVTFANEALCREAVAVSPIKPVS